MTGPLRLGSLCSGLGGLDIAAEEFFGARLAWYADNDPAARQVLAHHWPDATGHGDITTVDFTTMPAVDILTAGIPCQPHSVAGPRRGEEDHRDLWPATRDALRALGHPFLVMENVPGWARDLPRVVGDLAHLGYRVVWGRMGSYRIGTPHQRTRLWLCAQHEQPPAHPPRLRERSPITQEDPLGSDGRLGTDRRPSRQAPGGGTPGDARTTDLPGAADYADALATASGPAWPHGVHPGEYAQALTHWARCTGRPMPWPTDPVDGRPSPAALEWMMALPDGWTDLPGIGPKARRRLLGNAVCPAQAYAALAVLVPRLHEGAPGAAPTLDTSGPYG